MIERTEIHSLSDARELVAAVQAAVPNRKRGRRAHHREDVWISRFIFRQLEAGLYSLPILIERPRADPPDFYLTVAVGKRTGLEIREFGPERFQAAMSELERVYPRLIMVNGELYDPHSWPEVPAPTWKGDPARDWVRWVQEAIDAKVSDLPRHPPAARTELLLCDHSHAPGVDPVASLALMPLDAPHESASGTRTFDRVSIICDTDLLLDIFGERKLLYKPSSEPE